MCPAANLSCAVEVSQSAAEASADWYCVMQQKGTKFKQGHGILSIRPCHAWLLPCGQGLVAARADRTDDFYPLSNVTYLKDSSYELWMMVWRFISY